MRAVPTININLDATNPVEVFCEVHYFDGLRHMNTGIHGKCMQHLNKALLLLQEVYKVDRDYRRNKWNSVEKYITMTSFWIDRVKQNERT